MPRSLICCVLFTTIMAAQEMPVPPDTLYRSNPHYWRMLAAWDTAGGSMATVVMLGNSLTAGADWNVLLHRRDVANRGIVSDNTAGFLQRMRYVTDLRPVVCFLMGGINDIYAGFPVASILRNYVAILDTLRACGIVPVVQSTLFASPLWHDAADRNVLVADLNDRLRRYCDSTAVDYVDLNAHLSEKGFLKGAFTTDGIHLTPAGYAAWARAIMPVLGRYQRRR